MPFKVFCNLGLCLSRSLYQRSKSFPGIHDYFLTLELVFAAVGYNVIIISLYSQAKKYSRLLFYPLLKTAPSTRTSRQSDGVRNLTPIRCVVNRDVRRGGMSYREQ